VSFGAMFMNMRVVITVAIVMLIRDFVPCGIILMNICDYSSAFSRQS
jgi:hypothetical protein